MFRGTTFDIGSVSVASIALSVVNDVVLFMGWGVYFVAKQADSGVQNKSWINVIIAVNRLRLSFTIVH